MADSSTASSDKDDRLHLPHPKNSAGRNLPVAITTGVLLGILVIVCLIVPYAWYPMIAVVMGLATYEVWRRLTEHGYDLNLPVLLVGGQAMIWLSWPFGATGLLSAFAVTALVTVLVLLFHSEPTVPPLI